METKRTISRSAIIIVWTLRIIVGVTFIVSGFVKAIDPWGSVYKFTEYFAVMGLDWMVPFATMSAFVICIYEFAFGVFLLLGCYRRVAPFALTAMMAVLLPLTLWLAITDAVADCGCFGDAIQLSNWATFMKNVVLMAALVYLCIKNRYVVNVYGVAVQWIVATLSCALPLAIAFVGYSYQPLIDFRPYKVGEHLVTHDQNAASEPEYRFVYERDGVVKEFALDSIPDDDEWTYVDRIEVGGQAEETTPMGVSITVDGIDITDSVITDVGEYMILLFPNLDDVDISYTFVINEMYDLAQSHGVNFLALTSADDATISDWKDLSMAAYEMYTIDDSVLKQIARGNPAVVYVNNGVIVWKRSLQSIPISQFENDMNDMSAIHRPLDDKKTLWSDITLYLGLMLALLAINRTHKLFKIKRPINEKKSK